MTSLFEPLSFMGKRKAEDSVSEVEVSDGDSGSDAPKPKKAKKPTKASKEKAEKPKVRTLSSPPVRMRV